MVVPHALHCDCRRGLRAVQQGRVALVDGNAMFNRPGEPLWLGGV